MSAHVILLILLDAVQFFEVNPVQKRTKKQNYNKKDVYQFIYGSLLNNIHALFIS